MAANENGPAEGAEIVYFTYERAFSDIVCYRDRALS
jgi:hypothetical protein